MRSLNTAELRARDALQRAAFRAEVAERRLAELEAGILALATTKPGATGRALRALVGDETPEERL